MFCCTLKADGMTGPPEDGSIALDRENAASALVLREVHCGLLRAAEGASLKQNAAPPSSTPVTGTPETSSSQAQWSERVVDAIFSAKEPVGQDAWVRPLEFL